MKDFSLLSRWMTVLSLFLISLEVKLRMSCIYRIMKKAAKGWKVTLPIKIS